MTNEERARAIRRTWGLNIVFAASASKNDLGEACDGLEAAILSALDAATVPLVAERERLKQVLKQVRSASYMSDTASWPRAMQAVSEALAEDDRAALAEKEPG